MPEICFELPRERLRSALSYHRDSCSWCNAAYEGDCPIAEILGLVETAMPKPGIPVMEGTAAVFRGELYIVKRKPGLEERYYATGVDNSWDVPTDGLDPDQWTVVFTPKESK